MTNLQVYYSCELDKQEIDNILHDKKPAIIYVGNSEIDYADFAGREDLMFVRTEKELQEVLNFYNMYDYKNLERMDNNG